jgi:hypothetical protein
MPASDSRLPRRLRRAGAIVLGLGLGAAAVVYASAPASADGDALGYRIAGGQTFAQEANDPREMQQLERLGGKSAVMMFQFQRWVASLWHGRRLAWTLAVISGLVALLCFHLASLAAEDD